MNPSEAVAIDPSRPAEGTLGVEAGTLWEILANNEGLIGDTPREVLLREIVDRAIAIFRAQEGFLVAIDASGEGRMEVARARSGREVPDAWQRISRTVLDRTLREGEAILQRTSDGAAESGSIASLGLTAIMSVPIRIAGAIRGSLFLYTRRATQLFRREDLTALTAFASQAAIALRMGELLEENRVVRERLDEANRRLALDLSASRSEVVAVRRELEQSRSSLEAACEKSIRREHLSTSFLGAVAGRSGRSRALREVEVEAIAFALEETGGHRGRAARILGIGTATLTRKIREHGLAERFPGRPGRKPGSRR